MIQSLYYPAFISFFVLVCAWLYSFWPNLSVFFAPRLSPIFAFNMFGLCVIAYFIYRQRSVLTRFPITSSQLALLCLFFLIFVWIFSGANHLTAVQQTTAILIFPALVLICFGPYILRFLLFPLFMIILMILFYENPILQPMLWGLSVLVILAFELQKKFLNTVPKDIYFEETKLILTRNSRWLIPSLVAFSIISMSPWLSENIRELYPLKRKQIDLIVPIGMGEWRGPIASENTDWKPEFLNSTSSINVSYNQIFTPFSVNLFSAYYQSDRKAADLLNKNNTLYNPPLWEPGEKQVRQVNVTEAYTLVVNELVVENQSSRRLIWSWYYVLGVPSVDLNVITLLDGVRNVARYADGSGIIAVSTIIDSDLAHARERLESFIQVMYPSFEILERPEKI